MLYTVSILDANFVDVRRPRALVRIYAPQLPTDLSLEQGKVVSGFNQESMTFLSCDAIPDLHNFMEVLGDIPPARPMKVNIAPVSYVSP